MYWVVLEFSENFDGLLMESEEWRCGASKSIRATVVISVFCFRDCLFSKLSGLLLLFLLSSSSFCKGFGLENC